MDSESLVRLETEKSLIMASFLCQIIFLLLKALPQVENFSSDLPHASKMCLFNVTKAKDFVSYNGNLAHHVSMWQFSY